MVRYLKLLVVLPVAFVVIALAVANRGPATLHYLPPQMGGGSVTLPMFVVIFLAAMAGVLIGGMAAWFVQGRHRRLERTYRREADALKAEAARLRAMQPAEPGYALPALRR
jgi:uncharacterized integral membrane protein